MNINNEDVFVQRVRDAAKQLWLMRAWEYDQSLEREGWSTFYAVDADIFAVYGAFENEAQRKNERPGYSEVFIDDPAEGSYALAERLVDYIFFYLQTNSPLLVLPPIDKEIRSILKSLTFKLGKEPQLANIDEQSITSIINEITQIDDSDPIPIDILERFSTLIALRGPNSQTEYRRLTNLLLLRRLVPAHGVKAQDNYPDQIESVISHKDEIHDIYHHLVLSNQWLSYLERSYSTKDIPSRKRITLSRDAEALARLEIWNQRLKEYDIRILYITGSLHILNASEKYRKEGEKSFFYQYIRHPRYFLASPKVVVQSEEKSDLDARSTSQFYDWILTFLADCQVENLINDDSINGLQVNQHLDLIAKNAFKRDPKMGSELKAKWNNYLKNLSASYIPPQKIIELLKENLDVNQKIVALEDWEKFREKINARIELENDSAWEACFKTATRAGYFVGMEDGYDIPSRLVPPIRFDRWPHTEEFVRFMSQWFDPTNDIVSQYEKLLSNVKEETAEDFDYAYYLAHAALFAARGEWKIGAILSIRALSKASHPEPITGSAGHGRESCYLAAYCLRHMGRSSEDFDEAESYLDKASRIHEKELDFESKLMVLPERFQSEKLSIKMTKLLYHHYVGNSAGSESRQTYKDWRDLLRDFINISDEVKNNILTSAPDNPNLQQNEYRYIECASRLSARINANIMMLSILLEDYESNTFLSAGEALHEFITKVNGGMSYYLETIDMLWRVASQQNRPSRAEVNNHFSKADKHVVLAYDGLRYQDLEKKIKFLMKKKWL